MKYKKYVLTFKGDPKVVAFLKEHVPQKYEGRGALAAARRKGNAARELFGVEYEAVSVTVPRAAVERVKSL